MGYAALSCAGLELRFPFLLLEEFIMPEQAKRYRGQRGPAKKAPMAHVSTRISRTAAEFYRRQAKPTQVMRQALEEFAFKHSEDPGPFE